MRKHLRSESYFYRTIPKEIDPGSLSEEELDKYIRFNLWEPDGCPIGLGLTLHKAAEAMHRWNIWHEAS